VEQVSWDDAVEFCRLLSKRPAEVGARRRYRLPSEVEWEFACRAGTTTPFHVGKLISPKEANVDGDKPYLDSPVLPGLGRPAAVGSYPPNAFGLYDLHGNVWEWCSNPYRARLGDLLLGYESAPSPGSGGVVRGGAYAGDVALARSASRRQRDPTWMHRSTGFRVVCLAKELENR
jgi:formylglycine-generating enzyme required for sulfatase activity